MITWKDAQEIFIVRMEGQSNLIRGDKGTLDPPFLAYQYASKIWRGPKIGLETFSPGADGVAGNHQHPKDGHGNNSANDTGLALGVLRYLEEKYERPFVIFMYGIGGTAMLQASGESLSPARGAWDPAAGQLTEVSDREWRMFLRHLTETYPDKTFTVFGEVWSQGEADGAYVNSAGAEFPPALLRKVDHVRELVGDTDLPFVFSMPVRYGFGASSDPENDIRNLHMDAALQRSKMWATTMNIASTFEVALGEFTIDLVHLNGKYSMYEGIRAAYILDMMRAGTLAAPSAPTLLSISNITDTTVDISFSGTSREYLITANGATVWAGPETTKTISGLVAGTAYTFRVYAHNDAGETAYAENSATTTVGGGTPYSYLTQEEELARLLFTAPEIETILGRRYGTNILSTDAEYIPPDMELLASVTYAEGETYVDPVLGWEMTIAVTDLTIDNCEAHRVNNQGITFFAKGSGTSPNRNLIFVLHGQPYPVLGQIGTNSHWMTIDTGISGDSNEAGNRAWAAWWLSDSLIAWKSGDAQITYRDIITGDTNTFNITFPPGGYYLNLAQYDASHARMGYSGPLVDDMRNTYNAANPSVAIDLDKVYRIFHVSADKKAYIVLVYSQTAGTWSFLTGVGLDTSESATCVVHEIGLQAGTSVDHLTLAIGKGIYANTTGEGFTYHTIDGVKVAELYSASNHKGYGTIHAGYEWITEKATPSASQNTAYNASQGDMILIGVQPETASVQGYPILKIPTGEPAVEYGGDQSGHSGARVAVLAGHRDVQPTDDETFSHQVLFLDPVNSNLGAPYFYKYGRGRVANLAIDDTAGGDSDDPGAYPGKDHIHPSFPGRVVGEIYFTASRINHDGVERNFIAYARVPIEPCVGGLAALETALTNADFVSKQ